MTATDELPRLLDERGVEWRDDSSIYGTRRTVWTADGVTYVAAEVSGRLKVSGYLTPEQAVEATLGRGTCRMTRVEDEERILYGWMECSECGPVYPPAAERIQDAVKFCPFCGRKVVDV